VNVDGGDGNPMTAAAATGELASLLEHCLVRIDAGQAYGSGVFVAPGTILTCAHVVAGRDAVAVTWNGQRLTGRVVESAPASPGGATIWPYPDLAVLRLDHLDELEEVEHPCVWLGEQPYGSDAALLGLGHSTVYGGEPVIASARGRLGGRYGHFRRFVDDEVTAGMSGGPVLDEAAGQVCGLLKSSRALDTNLGGLVMPVAGLRELSPAVRDALWRAHDRYHAADPRWTSLRAAILAAQPSAAPGRALTAAEEADLLGLLAAAPPDDLERRYGEAAAPSRRRPDHLADYRDLVGELSEVMAGDLHPVLRMASRLAGDLPPGAGSRVAEWVVRVAGRRHEYDALQRWRERPEHAAAAPPSIIVQIEPGTLHPDRYLVTIWEHRGEGSSAKLYCDDRAAHDVEAVRRTIAAQLPPILRRMQGRATVEFVAPVELFNERFEELPALRSWTRLGRTNPVVLRDLDRLRNTETWGAWRERWDRMRATPAAAWLRCADEVDQEKLDGYLRAHPEISLYALGPGPDRSPGQAALEVALYAGMPVLVWRRGGCAEHDAGAGGAGPCSGDRFRAAFDAFRAGHAEELLPELVRQLRGLVADEPGHDCRDIVLLWDDPYRLPEPYAPLLAPSSSPSSSPRKGG